MRRLLGKLRKALVLAAGLTAWGCGDGFALDRLAAGESGRVVAVEAGDQVVLDSGLIVRLAGIETPRQDEPGGQEAQAALSRLVLDRQVQLYYGGLRRDRRGRALAQVRVAGGGWVEGAMLRDGEAQVRTFADNRAMARPMLDAEAGARLGGRGLWRSGGGFSVRLPEEARGGFELVEGRVRRVTDTGRSVYLDFTGRADGFAAMASGATAAELKEAGLDPTSLVGRLVRIRGLVGSDGLMRIDHPEQVETLREDQPLIRRLSAATWSAW